MGIFLHRKIKKWKLIKNEDQGLDGNGQMQVDKCIQPKIRNEETNENQSIGTKTHKAKRDVQHYGGWDS